MKNHRNDVLTVDGQISIMTTTLLQTLANIPIIIIEVITLGIIDKIECHNLLDKYQHYFDEKEKQSQKHDICMEKKPHYSIGSTWLFL